MTNISFKRKHFSLLLFVIAMSCFSISKAQNRFYEEGYVVTNSGDTIKGFIKHVRNQFMINTVDFKTTLNDSLIYTYSPSNIHGFYFNENNLKYESVLYSSNDKYNIKENKFGLLMVAGKINLYRIEMTDKGNRSIFEKENDHIYVIKIDTNYTVLREKEEENEGKYFLNKDYINQLYKISSNWDTVKGKISELGFSDQEIRKFIVINNDTSKNNTIKPVVYKTKLKSIVRHGVSFSYINSPLTENLNGWSAGYFWDIANKQKNEWFSLILGVEYMNIKVADQIGEAFRFPMLASLKSPSGFLEPCFNIGVSPYILLKQRFVAFKPDIGIGTYINHRVMLSLLSEFDFTNFSVDLYDLKLGIRLH